MCRLVKYVNRICGHLSKVIWERDIWYSGCDGDCEPPLLRPREDVRLAWRIHVCCGRGCTGDVDFDYNLWRQKWIETGGNSNGYNYNYELSSLEWDEEERKELEELDAKYDQK